MVMGTKLQDAIANNFRLMLILGGVVLFTFLNCQSWDADEWRKVIADVVAVLAAAKLIPSISQGKTNGPDNGTTSDA